LKEDAPLSAEVVRKARDLLADDRPRVERASLTETSDNQKHVRETAGRDEVIAAVRRCHALTLIDQVDGRWEK
jgi:hypothetical protein